MFGVLTSSPSAAVLNQETRGFFSSTPRQPELEVVLSEVFSIFSFEFVLSMAFVLIFPSLGLT